MRFKIPRKMYVFPALTGLMLLLSGSPVETLAGFHEGVDQAIFWSIHKDGETAGYLLGTIHSEDPRVLDFSEEFLATLKENKVFAMELVPDLPTLARLTEYMHYSAGTTLESVIGDERYHALVAALSAYKVPAEFISRMKPWAAMMTLSTPPPETGFFMDLSLSLRAAGYGIKVVGLETLEQQLSFLEEMPMPMQLSLLDQAIAEYAKVDEAHDEMVKAYLQNNLVELQALTDEQLQSVDKTASEYFLQSGIRDRNLRMMKSLVPHLQDNTVFIAVGALHLPGKEGLLNLLRLQGYELAPLEIPLRNAAVKPAD